MSNNPQKLVAHLFEDIQGYVDSIEEDVTALQEDFERVDVEAVMGKEENQCALEEVILRLEELAYTLSQLQRDESWKKPEVEPESMDNADPTVIVLGVEGM